MDRTRYDGRPDLGRWPVGTEVQYGKGHHLLSLGCVDDVAAVMKIGCL